MYLTKDLFPNIKIAFVSQKATNNPKHEQNIRKDTAKEHTD